MKHKHRIVPGYEGGEYTETNVVLLTITQHAMWHYAEWTRKKNQRDLLAWKGLKGDLSKGELLKESIRVGAVSGGKKSSETGKSQENLKKVGKSTLSSNGKKTGAENLRKRCSKPIEIERISTGERFLFPSLQEASRVLKFHAGNMSEVIKGKRSKCGDFRGRYLDGIQNQGSQQW
jgi:hypothetical protein